MPKLPVLALVGACLCHPASALAATGDFAPATWREGEIIVKYRAAAGAPARAQLKARLGLAPRRTLLRGRAELLGLPAVTDVPAALRLVRADPAVEYAEPNYRRWPRAVTPDDPLFAQQWGLLNTGQPNFVEEGPAGIPGADMNVAQAWDADGDGVADRTGDGSVIVAVIDDGVSTAHEDLAANIVAGFDFEDEDGNPDPGGDDAHGTMVAGCIGSVGNNGIGVAGVAWDVKLMPLRFNYDTASGIRAMEYARDHGARIVNASYGGPSFSQAELEALQELETAGVLFVAAAGNDDSNVDKSRIDYPANYDVPNIVSVAATNRQDGIASFSMYGPMSVDVAAPGLQIVTTRPGNAYSVDPGVSGTSFAAPYTAGVAALLWSEYPDATYREIKARLIEGADPGLDGTARANQRTAGGRINADKALDIADRPALVIRSVALQDAGNRRLDPGETLAIDVTVENLWRPATGVVATLASTDPAVTVNGGAVSLGALATGAAATARFSVTVGTDGAGYRDIFFTVSLSADGGYAAQRSFNEELAVLTPGVPRTQGFEDGSYDEFHTWHVDVAQVPEGRERLVFQTTAPADVDILVRRAQPAEYLITVGINPETDEGFFCTSATANDCRDPATLIGGSADGSETVAFEAEPGAYYVTVVNFAQRPMSYTLEASFEESRSRGGGAMGWPSLAIAVLAWIARRRRAA